MFPNTHIKSALLAVTAMIVIVFSTPALAATTVVASSPGEIGHMTYAEVNDGYGLLVWSLKDYSALYAQVVSRANNTPVGERLVLAEDGDSLNDSNFTINGVAAAVDPSVEVAPGTNTVLVAWASLVIGPEGSAYEILGRQVRLNVADISTLSTIRRLSRAGDTDAQFVYRNGYSSVSIAYNSTDDEYLVVWNGTNDIGTSCLFGQRVKPDGTPAADASVLIFKADDGTNRFLSDVIHDATSNVYTLAWSETSSPLQISAKQLSHDLTEIDPAASTRIGQVSGNGALGVKLVPDPDQDRFLLLYEDNVAKSISGRWIDDSLAPPAASFTVRTVPTLFNNLQQLSYYVNGDWVSVQYANVAEDRVEQSFIDLGVSADAIQRVVHRTGIAMDLDAPPGLEPERMQVIGHQPGGPPVTFSIDASNASQIIAATYPMVATDLAVDITDSFIAMAGNKTTVDVTVSMQTPETVDLPPGFTSLESIEGGIVSVDTSLSAATMVAVHGHHDSENGDQCNDMGGGLDCLIFGKPLQNGEVATFTIELDSSELDPAEEPEWTLGLRAHSVPAGVADTSPDDNIAETVITFEFADIALTSPGTDTVLDLNEPAEIVLEVANSGPVAVDSIALLLEMPESISVVDAKGCIPSEDHRSCDIGPVAPGSQEISLTMASESTAGIKDEVVRIIAQGTAVETSSDNNAIVIAINKDPTDPNDPIKSGGGSLGWLLLAALAPLTRRRK